MLIDSHVNLHGEQYAGDLDDVLARAAEAGVSHMLTISDRLDSIDAISAISGGHNNIWHSVGVHPHHAKDYTDLTAQRLIDLAADDNAIGIGECGMDFHYEYSDRAVQEPVFRAHVHAAQETGLPLIIHTREADDVTKAILLEEQAARPFTPLMHCYTSGPDLAEAALSLGGYVSFSGIITFKKADNVRAIAEMVPMDRLLIETDCPYLAPVPHRGRRNEPAFVAHVAERLAGIKGVSTARIAATTTENFFRLFEKAHLKGDAV